MTKFLFLINFIMGIIMFIWFSVHIINNQEIKAILDLLLAGFNFFAVRLLTEEL